MPNSQDIVTTILRKYPKSHAEELKIDIAANKPAPLFQWLICATLFSARISASQAQRAATALFDRGWTTPEKMDATSWEERVRVLNENGYARFDESTARYISRTAYVLTESYHGDLRGLREEAGRNPAAERRLIKHFKGIGDVGADIFFREVQAAWPELYPFADKKALGAAASLDLGESARDLADLVPHRADLPRLLSGLIRAELNHEIEAIRNAA